MDPLMDERFRAILPYLKGERPWRLASPEEVSLGYEAAASDVESEKEALEWCESFIGDGFED